MEPAEDNGISLIITEDGQYNFVNQSDQTSELPEGTEVIMQQGEDGVEVVYIVQPGASTEDVTYSLEDAGGQEEVRFVDENGTVIPASEVDMVHSETGNSMIVPDEAVSIPDDTMASSNMPDEAGDRANDSTAEEEEVNILLFCQYCGENLLTLDELRTHLKDEHDVEEELQSDMENTDNATVSLFPSCSECSATFLDEEDLKAHRTTCGLIDVKPDPDLSEVEEPFIREFRDVGHKCQLCSRVFRVRADLDVHIEMGNHGPVSGDGVGRGVQSMYHKCPYCPRMYMSKWHKKSLIKHIKDEHPDEEWDVPYKLVEAKNTGLLRRLSAKRGGYQSCFSCIYCSRKFLWQKSLARHYKDYHQDHLDTLEEEEVADLLGKKYNRSVTVQGDEANSSCSNCGKQFKWEKSLKRHLAECTEDNKNKGNLFKCLYCGLVSKYACSLRKHIKRFHAEEVVGINVNKIELPIVDMETYGHNVLTTDKRPADERLKDCPIVFKCKFCDYVTPGQSNLKRHLMSIKHNYTNDQLRAMKLSSFKVYQKPRKSSAGRPRKVIKEEFQSSPNVKQEKQGDVKYVKEDPNSLAECTDEGDVEGSTDNSGHDKHDSIIGKDVKTDGTTIEDDQTSDVQTEETLPIEVINKSTEKTTRSTSKKVVKANKNFNNETDANNSEILLTQPDAVFCAICNGKFEDFKSFIDHCEVHVNLKIDFMCSHCTESFPIFDSLKKHHTKKHKSLEFTGTKMNSISLMEIKSKQSKMKAFECPYCDLILSQCDPLRQHVSEEHTTHVVTIPIITQSSQSQSASGNRGDANIISGFNCGFCECVYVTIEDMTNHMRIIHPFVDKSSLGQGSSDSGSVRKSGRKRKMKYPGFDEDEVQTDSVKKQKLDFRSPIIKKTKYVEQPSKTVKASPVDTQSNKVTEEVSEKSTDKDKATGKNGSKEDGGTENKNQEETAASSHTSLEITDKFQPVVDLGKKVDSPRIKEARVVSHINDTIDLPLAKEEQVVKPGKKRGRKRKEERAAQQDQIKEPAVSRRSLDADVTSENKCPHCNFTCKRSSALTFHINFNHTKIKEEPLDEDMDDDTNMGKTTPRKRNSYGLATTKQGMKHLPGDVEKVNKSLKKGKDGGIQQRTKEAGIKKVLKTPKAISESVDADDDAYDEDLDLDDTDADQDYKPATADHSDEDLTDDEDCEVAQLDNEEELCLPVENIKHLHKCAYCSKKYNSKDKVINHVKAVHKSLISAKVKLKTGGEGRPIKSVKVESIKQEMSGVFQCPVCNFLCKTMKGLKAHMFTLHPTSTNDMNTSTEKNVNIIASLSNRFKCPYCRYKTYYKSSIIRHVRKVHPSCMGEFNVDDSCTIVPSSQRAKENREKVPVNGIFSCPYCGIINKWKKSIVRHIRVAHPEEPYDVEIDPVRIPEITNVKKYERLNIGFKKKMQCLHCSFACKILTHMKKHLQKTHDVSGEEGQTNYQFVYEKQPGVYEEPQNAWMDGGQQEIGVHNCPFCGTTYGWKKSLGFHVKRAHPDMLEVFETMEKMLSIVATSAGPGKFKRQKGEKCNQCGIVCISEAALQKHRLLKHQRKRSSKRKPYIPGYVTRWHQKKYQLDGRYRLLECTECGKSCTSLLGLRVHSRIHHNDKLIDCPHAHCNARFRWKDSLRVHSQMTHQHENPDVLKCEVCNTAFFTSQELRAHMTQSHVAVKPKRKPFVYKCKACKSTFDSANVRDHHFSTEHIELTEMCEICGGVFTTKKQLEQHTRRHEKNHADSTTMCDHCGMTMGKKSLKKHLLFKHPEKLVCKCAICSGQTLSATSVKCEICDKSFCQKMYLYSHKRLSHNIKDRVYKCKVCMATFSNLKQRNVHLHEEHLNGRIPVTMDNVDSDRMDVWTTEEDKDRTTHVIHVGQDKGAQYLPKLSESSLGAVIKELMIISTDKNNRKPFKCLLCGRAFGKSKYIKLHIRRNHVKDEDKPYRCKVCGSGFVRLTEFRKHSRSHSGFRPYKCRLCNKAFKQQANLIDHMHIHKDSKDFQCFICKRHFQQRGGMTSHILTHDTLKPFKCMFCEKGFTSRGELSRHMQKYSSQLAESKTFLCHICHTSFSHYPLLLRHIETHNPDKPFNCEACGVKFASFMSLYNHKYKMKHFLLSDIQIGEEEQEDQGTANQDAQDAVASLAIDLYENVETVQPGHEEETIYVTQDGSYVRDHPDMGKSSIVIQPLEAEEIVQTSHKLHDNEELLSIAKQLTELSTYTENENMIEFSVIHNEDEIMKDMLDADTEILASIEKQSAKPKAVLEPSRRKIPETLEEILHFQQVQQPDSEEMYNDEEVIQDTQVQDEVVTEEVVKEESEAEVIQEPVVNDIVTTSGELSTNMEELAALIAQNSQGLENTEGITAYETEDGVIYVCMPENVDSNSYEEVLNTAVQSITGETIAETQVEPDEGSQEGVGEIIYAEKAEDVDAPVIHVNINDVPDMVKGDGETYLDPVDDQSNMDILQQDNVNLYTENGVVEIENDERTFIKQELLDDSYGFGFGGGSKFMLENGVFTYQTCKLRYLISGRTFKCLECGKYSKTKKRLKDHLKRHIPVECRENACMYCNSRFVTGNELARHLAVHTDDRRYKCNLCTKSFRQPGHLTEHQLIHQNIRPHNCTLCFQTFRTKHQLIVHTERKHSTAKYECEECKAVLSSKIGLIIHKGSVHSSNFKLAKKGKKDPIVEDGGDFQCDKCGSAFSTALRLKKHIMKDHSKKAPVESKSFMCEVCGSMYQSKDYLKEHILKEHSDTLTEVCDQCGEEFKTARLLQLHKRRVHLMTKRNTPLEKKAHLCKVCQKLFSTRHALAYHIGVTPACKNAVE